MANLTKALPKDSGSKAFDGPFDVATDTPYFMAGTRLAGTEYAAGRVLLYGPDGTTPLITASGVYVQGPVAHDAAAAGNPLLLGGYASATAPTDVSANADVVRLWAYRNGALATVLTSSGNDVGAVIGTSITNTAVTTDANGTMHQYLRGLVTILGAVTASPVANSIGDRLKSLAALLPAALGAGGGLKVDGSGTALPVSVASIPSHAVTNAGTFAVQDATAEASLSVLDDWDESDRAKVNPIAGQAGVAAGAGAVSALTQRTTLASDDPAVATLGAVADAAVAAGATGSISAKLRAISRDIVANIVLAAGSAVIGKVGIDQTTPGTTNLVESKPFAGFGTIATGEVAGAASVTQNPSVACRLVCIKASYDNAGRVYIGITGATKADGTTDTTTGIQLLPGESVWLPISNLNLTYRICDNAGDDFTYLAVS